MGWCLLLDCPPLGLHGVNLGKVSAGHLFYFNYRQFFTQVVQKLPRAWIPDSVYDRLCALHDRLLARAKHGVFEKSAADDIVDTALPHNAASLLECLAPEAADDMRTVTITSSVTVTLPPARDCASALGFFFANPATQRMAQKTMSSDVLDALLYSRQRHIDRHVCTENSLLDDLVQVWKQPENSCSCHDTRMSDIQCVFQTLQREWPSVITFRRDEDDSDVGTMAWEQVWPLLTNNGETTVTVDDLIRKNRPCQWGIMCGRIYCESADQFD